MSTRSQAAFAGMQYIPYLLYDDEIFEEILRSRSRSR
jgi:hypothetical protein